MSFKILFRRSATAASVPATTAILSGEIVLNTTDGILYFKKTVSSVDSIVAISPNALTAVRLATPVTFTLSGDITSTATSFDGSANITLTASLPSTGTAGTYMVITTDAKGRVVAGRALQASDVTTALTYTPLNKAGDTVTGAFKATAGITVTGSATIDALAVGTINATGTVTAANLSVTGTVTGVIDAGVF